MTEERVPLYVRLPRDQAAALDRLVESTGRRKQHLVSEILGDGLAVGRIEFLRGPDEDVLTLEEAAALLRVLPETLRAEADAGAVPGRAVGEEWRFSREAVLAWLAHEDASGSGGHPSA
ncbi:MAG TPA: helix-turn-helix domain-containing protein [Solirubrobacteraceae bacterium]|nr:helix-turn-helix domain-containing protein [Solirubrobacteraceae bacterium]